VSIIDSEHSNRVLRGSLKGCEYPTKKDMISGMLPKELGVWYRWNNLKYQYAA
jgi:hypothetical protein